jgi:transposase
MKDFQLYQHLLGLEEPWRVVSVTLKRPEREVEVRVECAETLGGCPECQQRMHVHGGEERRGRHLDRCQFKTLIVAWVPRVICPEHGAQTVAVPWAEKDGRFSRLFERLAIDVMRECSVAGACGILGISWDEADGIKQRAVQRGLARKAPGAVHARRCVDEKSVGHGQNYMTIVAAVEAGQPARVDYVGEGRTQASLDAYWQQLTAGQLAGIEAVGMDLWEPFWTSTVAHVPGAVAKIVHDPYHRVSYMNEAVNEVRKAEHRRLLQQGDGTPTGTRQWWLYGFENVPEQHALAFDRIKTLNLHTARAWEIKEVFRSFWLCPTKQKAAQDFKEWYGWAIRSRLAPVKPVARMFKKYLTNLLTFFDHHLTNGPLEGLNNEIQGLIKKAFGYRNKERFKADIYFHLGGLDLYPSQ